MSTWILIAVFYSWGTGASMANESVALTSLSVTFHSKEACGRALQALAQRGQATLTKAVCAQDFQEIGDK